MRSNFFEMKVVNHWHRLRREAVDAPFLGALKVRFGRALRNVILLKMSLLTGLDDL